MKYAERVVVAVALLDMINGERVMSEKKVINSLMLKCYEISEIIAESLSKKIKGYIRKNDAVTAVEYAIVVAGVAAIVLSVFGTTGPVQTMLNETFTNLKTQVASLIGGVKP